MTWFAYRNIRRKDWSLRLHGLVVAHEPAVTLVACTFKVSAAGRRRVLATRTKNVHAGIEAVAMFPGVPPGWPVDGWAEVTYNPYKYETFVRRDTGEPVFSAGTVVLDSDGKAWMCE